MESTEEQRKEASKSYKLLRPLGSQDINSQHTTSTAERFVYKMFSYEHRQVKNATDQDSYATRFEMAVRKSGPHQFRTTNCVATDPNPRTSAATEQQPKAALDDPSALRQPSDIEAGSASGCTKSSPLFRDSLVNEDKCSHCDDAVFPGCAAGKVQQWLQQTEQHRASFPNSYPPVAGTSEPQLAGARCDSEDSARRLNDITAGVSDAATGEMIRIECERRRKRQEMLEQEQCLRHERGTGPARSD